jgi:predicted amidohydrolase YtcJ
MLTSPEKLEKLVRQFWKDGWQTVCIHQSIVILFRTKWTSKGVHCIGDKANHVMLDIYESIIKEGANVSEWRPRIEHAQIFAPADLERIGKLGGQSTNWPFAGVER